MTDLLNAYWTASATHRDASHACRAARRAGAPDNVCDELLAARRAAMAALRQAYEALHGLTD